MKAFEQTTNAHTALEADLQHLAALFKERQCFLLLLLEDRRQRSWERPEWLMRQCQYQSKETRLSRQIRSIVLRWVLMQGEGKEQLTKPIRQFWLKVKMVMKMSLERIKLLDFLNYSLFQRYESIIDVTNTGYDRALGLYLYRDIQEMIRGRNRLIHQTIHQTFSQQFTRNKSEHLRNTTNAKELSPQKSWKLPLLKRKQIQTVQAKSKRRPFSQQCKRKSGKLNVILNHRKIKKIQNKLDQYEEALRDVMEGKIQGNLDRKKTIQNNFENLYCQIVSRNIANKRDIQKFIFKYQGSLIPRLKNRQRTPIILKKARKPRTAKLAKKDVRGKDLLQNLGVLSNVERLTKRNLNPRKVEGKLKRMSWKHI